jgi:hypothetical protein
MLAHAEETIPPRRVDVADILDPHRLAGPELYASPCGRRRVARAGPEFDPSLGGIAEANAGR